MVLLEKILDILYMIPIIAYSGVYCLVHLHGELRVETDILDGMMRIAGKDFPVLPII